MLGKREERKKSGSLGTGDPSRIQHLCRSSHRCSDQCRSFTSDFTSGPHNLAFTIYNGPLSPGHHPRASSAERTSLCGFTPRPRCTRVRSSRALNFPESRDEERVEPVRTSLYFWPKRERIQCRDLALLPPTAGINHLVLQLVASCNFSLVGLRGCCVFIPCRGGARKDVPLQERAFKSPIFWW